MSRVQDLSRLFDIRASRLPVSPIQFSEGNPVTVKIPKTYPLDRLECSLAGNFNPETENPTLKAFGMLNLIQRFELKLDNKDTVFSLPGICLGLWSDLHSEAPGVRTAPAVTAGSAHAFRYAFDVPINTGPGYFSMLDMDQHDELIAITQWADAASCITGDTSNNDTVSAVQIDADAVGLAGAASGTPGGNGYDYPLHLVDFREYPITAAQADFELSLLSGHLYRRLAFMTRTTNNVPSDAILQAVRVQIGTSTPQIIDADRLKDNAIKRGYVASNVAGWYVFDFADMLGDRWPKLDQLIGTNARGLDFKVYLDVLKPGTDNIIVIQDHYARPSITRAVK